MKFLSFYFVFYVIFITFELDLYRQNNYKPQ